jgi:CheY-like chemotaxis protein
MIVAKFLEGMAAKLDVAETGQAAVELFKAQEYDVVLMDVQMPRMDGLTATRLIRAWEEEQRRQPTPIVALTASVLKEARDSCFAAGCTSFLAKPIRKSELLEAIAQVVTAAPRPIAPQATLPQGLPPELASLGPIFLRETRKELAKLAAALATADYADISAAGHRLAGCGSSFGADEITELGRSLEAAAKQSNLEEARRLVGELALCVERLDAADR